jgi:flagellar hook assembly protein FlgD
VKDTTYVMTIIAVDLDDNKSEPSDPLPVKAENSSNGPRITVKKVKGSTTNTAASIEYRLGQVIPTTENPTPAAITQAKMRIQLRNTGGVVRFTVAPDNALTPVNTPSSKDKKVTIPVSGATITDGTYYAFMQATHPTDNTKKTIVLKAIKVDKTAPVISNISKSSDIYSPDGSLFSTISYTINEASTVNIKINDAKGATVRTLSSKAPKKAGTHSIVWNGKNKSNAAVPDGQYTVLIEATNGVKLKTTNTTLKINVETKRPTFSKAKVSPTPLKLTTATATTTISYTISEKSKVTIKIYDKTETEVRTLLNEVTQEAGARTVTWNGKNGAVPSAFVADGTYQIRIDATDIPPATVKGTSGSDVPVASKQAVTTILAVVTDGKNLPTVTNVTATDESIISGTETTSVSYTLSESAKVTVQVLNGANSVVRTLDNAVTRAANTHTIVWNGRNASGALVPAGNYKIKITATDSTAKSASAEKAITVTAATPPPG